MIRKAIKDDSYNIAKLIVSGWQRLHCSSDIRDFEHGRGFWTLSAYLTCFLYGGGGSMWPQIPLWQHSRNQVWSKVNIPWGEGASGSSWGGGWRKDVVWSCCISLVRSPLALRGPPWRALGTWTSSHLWSTLRPKLFLSESQALQLQIAGMP